MKELKVQNPAELTEHSPRWNPVKELKVRLEEQNAARLHAVESGEGIESGKPLISVGST